MSDTCVSSSPHLLFFYEKDRNVFCSRAAQLVLWIDIFTGCITKDLNHSLIFPLSWSDANLGNGCSQHGR